VDTKTQLRGFSHVDRTADPTALVRYLDASAQHWGEVRQRIDAALDAQLGDQILDVGCGTGEAVRALAPRVGSTGRVIGVDSSQTMVAAARERAAGAGFPILYQLGDAHALPFPNDTFDGCLAEKLFTHLERPDRALSEMRRVTRSGGRVVVASADQETLIVDAPDRALTRRILNHACDSWLVHGWVGRQLPRLFSDAGLIGVTIAPVTATVTSPAQGPGAFDFRGRAEQARAAGAVTAAEAARWVAHLEEASQAGQFFSALTFFVVGGRKP
jgi:ubiquinone/menaquinone biosynthesis C-methylase UbiE